MITMLSLIAEGAKRITPLTIVLVVVGFIVVIFVGIFFYFVKVWIRASVSGAPVPIMNLIAMKLRKIPLLLIVDARIMAVKAGLDVSTNDLETHFLAGGNVKKVVQALIAADAANVKLSFKEAAAMDLAEKGVLDALHTNVNKAEAQPQQPPGEV